MLKNLKALIGIHQKGDATSAEIEDALSGARAEQVGAEQAGAEADAAYRAGLLRLEESELQRLIADKQAATVRRDRAAALIEALTGRLAQARAAEHQAERRRQYDEAARAQSAAAKRLAAEYPKHAAALADLLRTVAEADVLAARANESLPDGEERLTSVEGRVRRGQDVAGYVAEDTTFDAWCRVRGGMMNPDEQGFRKENADGRTGTFTPIGGDPVPVEKRRFRRIVTVPTATGKSVPSLASSLNLPGLSAGHIPFWTADDFNHPGNIIATIEKDRPSWGKPLGRTTIDDPAPQTEIIPLDGPHARDAA